MSLDRQRRRVLIGVLVVVAILVLAAQVGEVFEETELPTIDTRFRVRGAVEPPPDLLIVGIDDVTLQELGEPWPFSFAVYTRAVETLAAGDAAVIVLDVTAAGSDGDQAFSEALEVAPAVTLSSFRLDADGTPVVVGGTDALAVGGVRAADGRFEPDDDGVVRRFDHTPQDDADDEEEDALDSALSPLNVPTLPVVTVEQFSGRTLPLDITGSEGATIDLSGPAGTVTQVSFLSLVNGRIPAEEIAGKIVVVGPTTQRLGDIVPTALSESTSRAEVHAAAIDTLLRDVPLRTPPTWVRLVLTLLACLAPLLTVRLTLFRGLTLVLAQALIWLAVAQVAFGLGWILPVVAPIVGSVAAAVATVGVNYLFEVRARRRVREVFGRFVPPSVVRDLIEVESSGDLLRASNREVTVLFSDLRGFTTFSEQKEAEDVVGILNEYLSVVTDAIVDVDPDVVIDYLGDGVMAVFGVVSGHEDHADRALAAGLGVLDATARFDREMADQLDNAHFRVGIGINTGVVTAGNLGTVRRLKYTVIGDVVNTASRMEGMTKDTPYDLLLADATRVRLSTEPDDLVEHATMSVRGRTEPVRVWSLKRAESNSAPAST